VQDVLYALFNRCPGDRPPLPIGLRSAGLCHRSHENQRQDDRPKRDGIDQINRLQAQGGNHQTRQHRSKDGAEVKGNRLNRKGVCQVGARHQVWHQ